MGNLNILRNRIDDIDEKILFYLSERVKICEVIGEAKKKQGLPIKDEDREKQLFNHIGEAASNLALDPAQVKAVYREIVNMCSTVQVKKKTSRVGPNAL